MSDMHQYVECGLDFIYLMGTRYQRKTDVDGRNIVDSDLLDILEVDLLHHEIAKAIVLSPAALRGQELFFLRTELGLETREFCKMMGISYSRLSEWENASELAPNHADLCMRLIYAAGCGDGELGREVVRMLRGRPDDEREAAPRTMIFDRGLDGWRLVKQHNVPADMTFSD